MGTDEEDARPQKGDKECERAVETGCEEGVCGHARTHVPKGPVALIKSSGLHKEGRPRRADAQCKYQCSNEFRYAHAIFL